MKVGDEEEEEEEEEFFNHYKNDLERHAERDLINDRRGKKLGRWKAIIGFPVSFPSALIKR